MNKQVKGLLKGLRYISQVFDGEEEEEMQIGFPTDVKHVAHIGCDGPSAAAPSNPALMNEASAPSTSSFSKDGGREVVSSPKSPTQDSHSTDMPSSESPNAKPHRRSRRHTSSSESPGSESALPNRSGSPARSSRHSRRNQSVGSVPGSEPASSEGSRRRGSRHSSKSSSSTTANGSEPGSESSVQDLPSIPKQSRRRKTKVDSEDGSTRSSTRSKNPYFSDADDGRTRPVQTLETVAEGGI